MSPPHKRGAPPGNTNALKHGYYSQQLRRAHLDESDPSNPMDLKEEIFLLRSFIRHLLDLGLKTRDYQEGTDLLRVLSMGVSSLSRLIRIQHWIAPFKDERTTLFEEALARVQEQLHLKDV